MPIATGGICLKDVSWIREIGHDFIRFGRWNRLIPVRFRLVTFSETVLWKNLSHVEMRLERVKNHKPTAIDTQRCHRNHYQMTNEGSRVCFKGKQNNWFGLEPTRLFKSTLLVSLFLKRKKLVFLPKYNNLLWFWMMCSYISTLPFHNDIPIHSR